MKIIFSHYCLHLTDRTQGVEEHCQISKVLLHVKTVTVTVTVQYNFINYKISFISLSSSQLEELFWASCYYFRTEQSISARWSHFSRWCSPELVRVPVIAIRLQCKWSKIQGLIACQVISKLDMCPMWGCYLWQAITSLVSVSVGTVDWYELNEYPFMQVHLQGSNL